MRSDRSAKGEWLRHWPIALCAFLSVSVGVTHNYSLGLFIGPIEQEFGWSRGQITGGLMIVAIMSVTLAPFAGLMIDRFGARRIGLPGMIVYCSAIAALSTVSGSIWAWWALWVLVAMGSVLIKPTVWTAAVVSYFEKSRGLALAVTLSGAGLGSATAPFFAEMLIADHGWRAAYVMLALIGASISLPLAFFVFYDAEERRLKSARGTERVRIAAPGVSAREGFRSIQFVKLGVAALLTTMSLYAIVIHFVPMLSDRGIGRQAAAGVASLIGISAIVGRVTCGFLLDRLNARWVGAVVFAMPLVAVGLMLGFDGSTAMAAAIAIVVGLSVGGDADVISYLCTRYFGLRSFGTLFGTLVGIISLGTGTGPFLAGIAFDATGHYTIALFAMIPLLCLSAALIATMGSYPSFDAKRPGELPA